MIPLVVIVIVGLILYLPEHLGYHLNVPEARTNILLTSAITVFAAVEGYATYRMVELERERRRIEDARNELEKAYGVHFKPAGMIKEMAETGKTSYTN